MNGLNFHHQLRLGFQILHLQKRYTLQVLTVLPLLIWGHDNYSKGLLNCSAHKSNSSNLSCLYKAPWRQSLGLEACLRKPNGIKGRGIWEHTSVALKREAISDRLEGNITKLRAICWKGFEEPHCYN